MRARILVWVFAHSKVRGFSCENLSSCGFEAKDERGFLFETFLLVGLMPKMKKFQGWLLTDQCRNNLCVRWVTVARTTGQRTETYTKVNIQQIHKTCLLVSTVAGLNTIGPVSTVR
eukprot:Plantae.Rhodophyta-Hildenbrandia_rubra.ctg4512.p1 GENE.Plantae.Rhodophyta-Hildenbrandia_rubra.ctg4512~~Plantae.Rhodophyta-Hildenbrandia_rubra.ctg4512.p1  ORF type:complete len:116 (-),score=0.76 Plantae.Rhodophyta-Hildenbrandia_rubra.ctg4512:610-957(-)